VSEFDDLLSGETDQEPPKRRAKAKRGKKGGKKGKAPCKYGPRDEDGRCPKKPKAEPQDDDDDEDDKPPPKKKSWLKDVATDVAQDVYGELKKKPRRRTSRSRSRSRSRDVAEAAEEVTNKPAGKSVLTKVAPLAARLAVAAAVIGAVWWTVKSLEGRAVRKKVEANIASVEARLRRPLTQPELNALLPQYQKFFTEQLRKEKLSALSNL